MDVSAVKPDGVLVHSTRQSASVACAVALSVVMGQLLPEVGSTWISTKASCAATDQLDACNWGKVAALTCRVPVWLTLFSSEVMVTVSG